MDFILENKKKNNSKKKWARPTSDRANVMVGEHNIVLNRVNRLMAEIKFPVVVRMRNYFGNYLR